MVKRLETDEPAQGRPSKLNMVRFGQNWLFPRRTMPDEPSGERRPDPLAITGDGPDPECDQRELAKPPDGKPSDGEESCPGGNSTSDDTPVARMKYGRMRGRAYSASLVFDAKTNDDDGWRRRCCWKPILIAATSIVATGALAVFLVFLFNYLDTKQNAPPESRTTNNPAQEKGIQIFTGHLSMTLNTTFSEGIRNKTYRLQLAVIGRWFQMTLDHILEQSYPTETYLYSHVVDLRYHQSVNVTFKMYFYDFLPPTSERAAYLSDLISRRLPNVSPDLTGYDVSPDIKGISVLSGE